MVTTRRELVLGQEIAGRGDERDRAQAGATLRLAELAFAAHAPLDMDEATSEVDVAPDERPMFDAPQARINLDPPFWVGRRPGPEFK